MIVKRVAPDKTSLIKPPISKKVKFGCLELKKGEEVGRHKTSKREEVIFIVKGIATVEIEGQRQEVAANHLVYIPPEKMHNILNLNKPKLRYIYLVSLFN